MKKIVAVILARGGSKRVPNKNIRNFKGQPLIAWSIKAALSEHLIKDIVVSTDSSEISEIAISYGADVVNRPKYLASDTASSQDALEHVLSQDQYNDSDFFVVLQPTSPLRESDLIFRGLSEIIDDDSVDSVIELNCENLFTGSVDSNNLWKSDFSEGTMSQSLPSVYFPSGRLWVFRCASGFEANTFSNKNCKAIIGEYSRNINIDYEHDFDKLDFVYNKYSNEFKHLIF